MKPNAFLDFLVNFAEAFPGPVQLSKQIFELAITELLFNEPPP
jgi:hypothetical protein